MRSSDAYLSGWGRTIVEKNNVLQPAYLSDFPSACLNAQSVIARGCGKSYGDESWNANGQTILTTHLNHFVAFDATSVLLTCESGVTLREIQQVFLPRGYALITSPGTADITVGGAIANDVHGKNQDQVGSFGDHIVWMEVLLSTGEVMLCSRDENPLLFLATVGGLGLTGVILRVCLRLQKHPMGVLVKDEIITNLDAFLARFRMVRKTATYSVAWLDLFSRKHFCHGVLSTAEPEQASIAFSPIKSKKLPPLSDLFLQDFTIGLHNRWHYFYHSIKKKESVQPLMQYLYPLDGIQNWNTLYGKRGFYQFQCVLPDHASDNGLREIIALISKSKQKPYLTVLKTFGRDGSGLMSFPMRGFTLAMDFPNKKDTIRLLHQLEDITVAHQGRLYFAKDACMRSEHLESMYPNISAFRDALVKYDAVHRWESRLSKRVGIR